MINPQRLALPIIVVLVLCSASAHAQTPAQTSETSKELREKAFNLLESLAGQVNGLQSAENRARITANIADSLWTHDEKRARSLFAMVESDINEALSRDRVRDSQSFAVFLKLRADTIDRIAKYDPELALTFLKATAINPDPQFAKRMSPHSDDALELRLAQKIAANNPDSALKLGRASLARGLSDDHLMLLRQLSRKHKEHAHTFYKEIVNKIRDIDITQEHWGNRTFIQRLSLSFTPPTVDESTFRELQSLLVTRALENGCRNQMRALDNYQRVNFCRWVMASLPKMGTDSRVTELEHWGPDRFHSSIDGHFELRMVEQDGSVDEILALKEKYPEMQERISWRAFDLARESGDLARAREVANSSANPEMRKTMVELLDDRGEKAEAFDKDRMAELERRLNELSRDEDRFFLLLRFAEGFAATNRSTALKLLNQASDIVHNLQPPWQQTGGQMGLAIMYCRLKSSNRCFRIMESLLPKLNQLVDAAARLDGFDTQYLRDGEWNMSANGRVGELLTGLSQHAGHFASCDFDRAVSLSNQFERTEIRLMAQVKLAQSILAAPQSLFSNYQRFR